MVFNHIDMGHRVKGIRDVSYPILIQRYRLFPIQFCICKKTLLSKGPWRRILPYMNAVFALKGH